MAVRHFNLGDLVLRSRQVLHDAWLAYATWGKLNAAADNCVLFPTYYTGTIFQTRASSERRTPWILPGGSWSFPT